jgi:protein-tyrosine phosphatase
VECVFTLERHLPNGERLPSANLYLGNQSDADAFRGQRLCVLEEPNCRQRMDDTRHIAILEQGLARRAKLTEAAEYITQSLAEGAQLLVHCGAGVERSPLTVAWWYVHIGAFTNLDTAYAALKAVRPQVEDRRAWLEPAQ